MATLHVPCLQPTKLQVRPQLLCPLSSLPKHQSLSKFNKSFHFHSSLTQLSYSTKRNEHSPFRLSSATLAEAVVSRGGEDEKGEFCKDRLLASNVPWTCTPEDIRALFEKHGKVIDVKLSMHNKTRNRGLAFVTMGSPEEASNALKNLESYEFEGRVLKLNYAKQKKKSNAVQQQNLKPNFRLFVGNISHESKSDDLKELFNSGSDKVVSAEVIFNDTPGKSSGYGFVSFKSKKAAEEALIAFQGKLFMGRPIRVEKSRQFVQFQKEENRQS